MKFPIIIKYKYFSRSLYEISTYCNSLKGINSINDYKFLISLCLRFSVLKLFIYRKDFGSSYN